uniref:Vomeronasal type-1 receptor n=1 Tax=Catagonus wagneri TaxID=51154 RepID=A0A8C3VYC1_9CETA
MGTPTSENILNDGVDFRELAIGIILLLQVIVGIWGNLSLLYHYLFLYHPPCRPRATDLICKHLTLANFLVILSTGVPQTMAALGLKYFFNDFACRLFLYFQRVFRGVSIGATCLLSVFQTITISPIDSCWMSLKVKAPKYVGSFISLCWIQCIFVNLSFPIYILYVSGKGCCVNITRKRDLGYCDTNHETITSSVYVALIVFPEVSFSVLIIWASGSMVSTLYRHRQRVQYIHRVHVSPRSSAESRATRRILALVSTFVCFHTLSSIFRVAVALFQNPGWLVVNANALTSVCFPSISPFLLVSHSPFLPLTWPAPPKGKLQ